VQAGGVDTTTWYSTKFSSTKLQSTAGLESNFQIGKHQITRPDYYQFFASWYISPTDDPRARERINTTAQFQASSAQGAVLCRVEPLPAISSKMTQAPKPGRALRLTDPR